MAEQLTPDELQEIDFEKFLQELPEITDCFDTRTMRLAHLKGVTLGIEIATAMMKRQAE